MFLSNEPHYYYKDESTNNTTTHYNNSNYSLYLFIQFNSYQLTTIQESHIPKYIHHLVYNPKEQQVLFHLYREINNKSFYPWELMMKYSYQSLNRDNRKDPYQEYYYTYVSYYLFIIYIKIRNITIFLIENGITISNKFFSCSSISNLKPNWFTCRNTIESRFFLSTVR